MSVKASQVVEAGRSILGASYVWWQIGDPLPKWYYEYPYGPPPPSWVYANGIHCADYISYARQLCGLPAIGGTGDYQDWLEANGGETFDPSTPGVPGALCVHRYEGPYGSAQGHVAMYTDEHTLIQATSMYGVNEGEQDYDSHQWANYYIYGLMPDVDYSGSGEISAPAPSDRLIWQKYGWWTYESETSWNLTYYPPEGE